MSLTHACHIVHIDDNPQDLELMQLALTEAEVQPATYRGFNDPLQGVRQLTEGTGDTTLVILDLNMPRMSGIQVLTRLRAHAPSAVLTVVVFTTSLNPQEHATCMRLGARAVFHKPDSFDGMCAAVKAIMEYC